MAWLDLTVLDDDPSLAEQERLAAENAAALEEPNYVDPWDHLLDLDPDRAWPYIDTVGGA